MTDGDKITAMTDKVSLTVLEREAVSTTILENQSVCIHAKSLQSYPTLCDPMNSSLQGSSIHRFSMQEHWSGLLCPSPYVYFMPQQSTH